MAQQEQLIKLYQTGTHPCSYLPGQEARTHFIDPGLVVDASLAEYFADMGFRRSGKHTYRPACAACSACIPLRVRVQEFSPNRTQRKILNRNQDLQLETIEPRLTLEIYRLYRRYINTRHRDGDMFPASARQFQEFLGGSTGYTRFWCFREQGRLSGVAVTDHFPGSLSSVYSFFDPNSARRSLGNYFVLRQIEAARQAGFEWLHLGYWVSECRKMSYKTSFPPQDILQDGHWRRLQA